MKLHRKIHLLELLTLIAAAIYAIGAICMGTVLATQLNTTSLLGFLLPVLPAGVAAWMVWRRKPEYEETMWPVLIAAWLLLGAGLLLNLGIVIPDPSLALEPSQQIGFTPSLLCCFPPGLVLLAAGIAIDVIWVRKRENGMGSADA